MIIISSNRFNSFYRLLPCGVLSPIARTDVFVFVGDIVREPGSDRLIAPCWFWVEVRLFAAFAVAQYFTACPQFWRLTVIV